MLFRSPGEGTNLVRISGDIVGHHFDCSPVTEIPFKITKARWPFVPAFIEPNPNYEFQTFNYDVAGGGQWIPIDSKSQGQILTIRDLENLPVLVSTKEQQKEIVNFYNKKNEEVIELQRKLQKEKEDFKLQLEKMFGSDKVFTEKVN